MASQSTAMLGNRLPPLICCLGIDKVSEPLGFGEIDLAVAKSPHREFPRLGEPQPKRCERLKDASHHRPPAMNMQLDHVFPGEIGGTRKPQHDSLIQNLPGMRMAQSPEACDARRGESAAAQRMERVSCGSAGNAYNGNSCTPRHR
jgi:hypothetical protein